MNNYNLIKNICSLIIILFYFEGSIFLVNGNTQINSSDSIIIKNKITIAKNYLYKKQYDTCKFIIKEILDKDSTNKDALDIIINASDWSGDHQLCLKYCNSILRLCPNNNEYLTKKLKSLYFLRRYKEAKTIVNQITTNKYSNSELIWIIPAIKDASSQKILLSHVFLYYYPAIVRYHLTSVGYGFQYGKLYLMPKINLAQITNNSSPNYQFAIDLKPQLKNDFYPYINYSFSSASLHPAHVLITEIYKTLPQNFISDVGFYYMKFHDSKKLYIITCLGGKTLKRTSVMLKPFFTINNNMIYQSYSFIIKKTFNKSQDYINFDLRFGKTPFNAYYLISDKKSFSPVDDYRLFGEVQYSLSQHISFTLAFAYGQDKYGTVYSKFYESDFSIIAFIF